MSTRVAVVGAGGRMGQTILRCLDAGAVPGLTLTGAVDLWDSAALHQPANRAGLTVTSDLAKVAPGCDVIIDFSSHHGTAGNAPRIAGWGKAWVIGTTGLSADEKAAVAEAAKSVPVVLAPNMSLGVNLLLELVRRSAAILGPDYDAEIVEMHHRLKKDAPSGTALGLAEALAAGRGVDLKEIACYGREGMPGERPRGEIGIHALRGGATVGDHTVLFVADEERIELTHRANSRKAFATGALRAALWLQSRKPGIYTMRHVLGFESV